MSSNFRVVADTNVILSSQKGKPTSPAVEMISRWECEEFTLLLSDDTLSEYIEKMLEMNLKQERIQTFVTAIIHFAVFVRIDYYHERYYPVDPDDVAFLLCALNGNATHLVSYDRHLLDLDHRYDFEICKPIPFLQQLRASL